MKDENAASWRPIEIKPITTPDAIAAKYHCRAKSSNPNPTKAPTTIAISVLYRVFITKSLWAYLDCSRRMSDILWALRELKLVVVVG